MSIIVSRLVEYHASIIGTNSTTILPARVIDIIWPRNTVLKNNNILQTTILPIATATSLVTATTKATATT